MIVLLLAAATAKTVGFESEDLRLNIVREARDAAGRWRPIEHLHEAVCGLSFHRLYLPAGRHWAFAAPVYHGPFRTQMRFVLEQEDLRLVSNEFAGAIHPGQFTRHALNDIIEP